MKYWKGESQARKEIIEILEEDKNKIMEEFEECKSISKWEKVKIDIELNDLKKR